MSSPDTLPNANEGTDYPAVMPLSLEGLFEVFKDNVIEPTSKLGIPRRLLAEESFWSGASCVMSIMVRAKMLGATPEEGAAIIGRLFNEITARDAGHDARIMAGMHNVTRD